MSEIKKMLESSVLDHSKSSLMRVLLVEDNPGDARLVKEMLAERHPTKFSLEHVSRISAALDCLKQQVFEIILLDLSLPDGHGLVTLNNLLTRFSHIPIVVLTGLDDEKTAMQAVSAGAQDYLIKGNMDGRLLSRAINYAIERKKSEERLRESEEVFRQLAENLKEVFYVYEEGIPLPVYISPAYEEVWGHTCKSFYENPKSFLEAIHPEDQNRATNSFAKRDQEEVEEVYRILRPDGSTRWINDHSFPISGQSGMRRRVVGIARDITDQKLGEERLRDKSFRDSLTGLYNRTYFQEEVARIQNTRSTSVAVVMFDVDGLKLINDTFGHTRGDTLLKAAAKVIKDAFRAADVVSRFGGDEFSVLLTNTPRSSVEMARERINEAVARYNACGPRAPLSISVGLAVADGVPESINDLVKESDDNMYREKLRRSEEVRSSFARTLMDTLRMQEIVTQQRIDRLRELLTEMAIILELPENTLAALHLLAQFHDIGKIGLHDTIVFKDDSLNPEQCSEIQRHCEIGYRIALLTPQLIPIADRILKHHEWWNGQGYPLGLEGDDIPIECRIFAIADAYEALTGDRPHRRALTSAQVVMELRRQTGSQFDPDLLERVITMLETHAGKPEQSIVQPFEAQERNEYVVKPCMGLQAA